MNITSVRIQVIPNNQQRYPTVGDWLIKDGELLISVSETGDGIFNMAIGLHELVEALLCEANGVKEEDVSAFDIAFEEKRQPGNDEEPGDQPDAPYHVQHGFATAAERLFIAAAGKNWKEYEEAVGRAEEDAIKPLYTE